MKRFAWMWIGLCAACSAGAEVLTGAVDLNGNNRMVLGGLTGDAVITNSSATVADLIIVQDDEGFATLFEGTVAGNIRIVKQGAGPQRLSANTHTQGTRVEGGYLCFSALDAFGSGGVTLADGGGVWTLEDAGVPVVPFVFEAEGALRVSPDKTWDVSAATVMLPSLGKTLRKAGGGRLRVANPVGAVQTETLWIVEDGKLEFTGTPDLFGNHSSTTTNLTLDIRRDAEVTMPGGHNPIGKLVLEGGTLNAPAGAGSGDWGNTALKGGVVVKTCDIPSYIKASKWIHLNHVATGSVVEVQADAALVVEAALANGYGTAWLDSTLTKTGAGDLFLMAASRYTGETDIQEGRVFVGTAQAFGPAGAVSVADGVTLGTEGLPDAVMGVPLVLNGAVTVDVADPDASMTWDAGVTGVGSITKTGAGALWATGAGGFASLTALNVDEGLVGAGTLAGLPAGTVFELGTWLGLVDFESGAVAALTAYPALSGLYSAQSAAVLGALDAGTPARPFALGCALGTTLDVGTLSGVTDLAIIGKGFTTIGALSTDIESITVADGSCARLPVGAEGLVQDNGGMVFFGDGTAASMDIVLRGGDTVLVIPAGTTVTATSLTSESPMNSLTVTGGGTLIMPTANLRAVYRTLTVRDSTTVRFSDMNQIGAGGVVLADGILEPTASLTLNVALRVDAAGTLTVPEGLNVNVSSNYFFTSGTTWTKKGAGMVTTTSQFQRNCFAAPTTWVVEEGILSISNGDTFGSHSFTDNPLTVRVHENGVFRATGGHLPMVPVILRGGTVRSTFFPDSTDLRFSGLWRPLAFKGKITVEANAKESVIEASSAHLGHTPVRQTEFHVAEGATLVVDAPLYDGHNASNLDTWPAGLVKTGKGVLRLLYNNSLTGVSEVREGIVEVCSPYPFGGADGTLKVFPGATLRLADGMVWSKDFAGISPFLFSADVWVDASTFVGVNQGGTVAGIENLGTCGGSFTAQTVQNGANPLPELPTYSADGMNGLPAFAFNGNQALVLPSYTNNTQNLAVFAVLKRGNTYKQWDGFASFSRTSATGNDNGTTGSFHGAESSEGKYTFYYGSGANLVDLNVGAAEIAAPHLLSVFTTNTLAKADVIRGDGSTAAISASRTETSFLIDLVQLGGRLGINGSSQYVSANSTNNRMWTGLLGELLVFTRALSDDEAQFVRAYLAEKWLDAPQASAPIEWDNESAVTLEVAANDRAVFAASAGGDSTALRKTGAGELTYSGRMPAAGSLLDAAEGALILAPSVTVPIPDVWMDPTDADSRTLSGGLVETIRNKGKAGGTFTANPNRHINSVIPELPPLLAGAINGNAVLNFEGRQALILESYTNNSATRDMTIYMVGQRTGYEEVGGKGKWGAPFSLISYSMANGADQSIRTGFHIEEIATNLVAIQTTGWNSGGWPSTTCRYANGEPFILVFRSGRFGFSFTTELLSDTSSLQTYRETAKETSDPYIIDLVQIGGRLMDNGAPQYFGPGNGSNRMWQSGYMGEFMIFNRPPTQEAETAIIAYLRAKWLGKDDATAPAAWVGGATLTPTLNAATAFSMGAGTRLDFNIAPQNIAQLEIGANAVLRRSYTAGSDFALFNVAGDITLPSALSLHMMGPDAPTATTSILTYGGALNPSESAWTLAGERAGVYRVAHKPGQKRVDLVYGGGTLLLLK